MLMFVSLIGRFHPQHGAAGLREESQPHLAGGGVRLRHEALRSRAGQRQSEPGLPARMDRSGRSGGVYARIRPPGSLP